MNWNNVRLILSREVRDQLRDRRTLFMIFVLPMLLYPLMGMSFAQISQFIHERATRVRIIGQTNFEGLPPLVVDGAFSPDLFPSPSQARLLELEFGMPDGLPLKATGDSQPPTTDEAVAELSRLQLQSGAVEAVVYFPADFAERLAKFRESLRGAAAARPPAEVPSPVIYYNTVQQKSQITLFRVSDVLNRWREAVGQQNLQDSQLPAAAVRPFDVAATDIAEPARKQSALWAKILPFVLLLWALTGAFYPAIDLCAGEKERGTLETLLCSPAQRIEIVVGKLVTIMLFSMATSLLNVLCMGLTGILALKQVETLGAPPLADLPWLVVALVPISALFSALCLALAAFARSSKEGQYYLMPLVLVTMPLTLLPMAPGVELNLGNSLIPITGMVLLLRTVLEGSYLAALTYAPAVLAVTLACCVLAIRWAADQFNKESVLFRESERLEMGVWLRHLVRDREATPSVANAVFCGVLILAVEFFLSAAVSEGSSFLRVVLISQLAVVLTPTLLMTTMLTRNPAKTLLLTRPKWSAVPMAFLLALVMHPLAAGLAILVQKAYPVNEGLTEHTQRMLDQLPTLGLRIAILALLPAICEELAFRGFILSGLRHIGRKWRAIVISSVFFGLTHGILQQSIVTATIGLVLGYVAVQTGSLLPGIIVHFTHNAITMLHAGAAPPQVEQFAWWPELSEQLRLQSGRLHAFFTDDRLYGWPALSLSALASLLILLWFRRLSYTRTEEESLQEQIERQTAEAA